MGNTKPPLAVGRPNDFQTPPYALDPLLPYIEKDWHVWECACGKGYLVKRFEELGYKVTGTDVATGQDFFTYEPDEYDCIITNPPFRFKGQFWQRCYELGKPFALLMPLTALETKNRQQLMKRYGVEIILLDRRINFETPNMVNNSSSWFASAWFTNGLNIGAQLNFASVEVW